MDFIHQNYNNRVMVDKYNTLIFEPHLHRAAEIIFMLKGSCSVIVDGREAVIKAGDALVVFPNCIHSYVREENPLALGIIFDVELFPELAKSFRHKRLIDPVITSEKLSKSGLENLAYEMADKYFTASNVEKKGYLLLFVGKLLHFFETEERQDVSEEIIDEIFNICRENCCSITKLTDVSKRLHISAGYLSHIFSKRINMSFCDYINSLKTSVAAELISKTDKSMAEIAELSGFLTLRTFNRAFKKHLGVSPTNYKKGINKIP